MKRLILLITFIVVSLLSQSQNTIKILLIGSSHGRVTIGQFPILASKSGVDIVCGNAYAGGLKLKSLAEYCITGELFPELYSKFYDETWHDNNPCNMTILEMLQDEEWDIICIQRAAAEDRYWNDEQAHSLETILEFIKDNCRYNPQIVFNSGFADSYSIIDREKQQQETEEIWSSAQNVKKNYGIEIIPMAPIIQLLRNNDELAVLGTYEKHMMSFDSQHLDLGIGMYASGCICYDFFLKKRFGKSCIDNLYLPTVKDISYGYRESAFTPIDEKHAKMIRIIVDDWYKKQTVGISSPTNEELIKAPFPAQIYSLDGRRITHPKRGGLYIIDGKKVLWK